MKLCLIWPIRPPFKPELTSIWAISHPTVSLKGYLLFMYANIYDINKDYIQWKNYLEGLPFSTESPGFRG